MWQTAASVFFGAFFAFLFIRIGDFFRAFANRMEANHLALVQLERQLNVALGQLGDNILLTDEFLNISRQYRKAQNQRIFIWTNRFKNLDGLLESNRHLINIDLINEIFTLDLHLRKINESLDTVNEGYQEAKHALLNNVIDNNGYFENMKRMEQQLSEVRPFLSDGIRETKSVLGAVRVLLRRRTFLNKVLRYAPSYRYDQSFEEKRRSEQKQMEAELEQIREASMARIRRLQETDCTHH